MPSSFCPCRVDGSPPSTAVLSAQPPGARASLGHRRRLQSTKHRSTEVVYTAASSQRRLGDATALRYARVLSINVLRTNTTNSRHFGVSQPTLGFNHASDGVDAGFVQPGNAALRGAVLALDGVC